ncbi:hypothetical protein HAX39_08155 [Citrobacter freundii]|nr:hypothetical protein [Citrobacter freundii]
MFDSLRESWFITKVENVIQTEIEHLPALLKSHTEGIAHAIVMHQYRHDLYPFSKVDGKIRLNPIIVAVHSVLTFIITYNINNQIIVNGENCLGTLKIICLNLMKQLDITHIDISERAFIEMFSGVLFKQVFPELSCD